LNRLALYWFDQTRDIIDNHIAEKVSGRTVKVQKGEVLPVEVVIRAYLTGSAWRDYEKTGIVSGIELPSGMKFNERFPEPLFTPSTKAERGTHDEPISSEEVIQQKLVDPAVWKEVEEAAFKLFQRGTDIARSRGLLLVDTKYEFGIHDGKPFLVDEVHTPDSSRFWFADTYEELFDSGEKQRKIDKEYLRQWLMEEKKFMGDGDIPDIPDDIRLEVASRYIKAYELITGEEFIPEDLSPEEEKERIFSHLSL
jgi:phosphoribosylaminoimidazole-succinocarboxamide synthase